MSNRRGTVVRAEERVSPGDDGYPYSVLYNHRGDVEQIQEDYYKDGFSLKGFLAEGVDPKKGVVKIEYSLGDIMEELGVHETNDGAHELSRQMAEIDTLKNVAVWLNRDFNGGTFVNGYLVVEKAAINDRKPLRRRMGRISPERYLHYLFNHEGIHALTTDRINKVFSKKAYKSDADKLNALYRNIRKNSGKNGFYGMTELDEFIAETYTSPEFQKFLSDIELPETLTTKRYVGGRNAIGALLCFLHQYARKRENVDLGHYVNALAYISDITSDIAGSRLHVVPLKGYGL